MDLDFSDDQKEFGSTLRRFYEESCPTAVVRAVIDSDASYDAGLWRKLSELGYLAAAIPEEYGGAGAGYLELCLVAEETGRALAPIPTVPSIYVAVECLLAAGSKAQKSSWLPKLASGAAIGTLALAEQPGETTPAKVNARVTGGKLTGVKIPVCDGAAATFAITAARNEGGELSLYLVDLSDPSVTRTPVKTIDQSRKHARLAFNATPAEPIGAIGQGWNILAGVRNRAAVLVAFEQLGGADRALEMGRDYALERYAFGRQIGSFQSIKHMLADMYVATALARSNAYYGAWALSAGSPELAAAAASTRVAATKAYQLCSTNNIQVHGGMGFTWEYDCHLHYRRSNYLALTLGGPSHWENLLIERLLIDGGVK